jgi:hypothetical protein
MNQQDLHQIILDNTKWDARDRLNHPPNQSGWQRPKCRFLNPHSNCTESAETKGSYQNPPENYY